MSARFAIRIAAPLLALAPAACLLPAPPPPAAPPEVVPLSANVRPSPEMLDPFVGRYVQGAAELAVRRDGDRLVALRAGQPPALLALIGRGTFVDGAGNSYLFAGDTLTLVASGGARGLWQRR